jgi:hypothetical protein
MCVGSCNESKLISFQNEQATVSKSPPTNLQHMIAWYLDIPSRQLAPMLNSPIGRFFYKYNPLYNIIVRNNPLWILLPKMTWRNVEKPPRDTSRHSTWRTSLPATGTGGLFFPPLQLAECGRAHEHNCAERQRRWMAVLLALGGMHASLFPHLLLCFSLKKWY